MPGETRSDFDAHSSPVLSALRRFGRDEDGSIISFVLVIFLLMLAVAAMSVDVMRHEENRALLQATLDRSVLASASLDQSGGPAEAKAIVEDYFTKSGVNAQLQDVRATTALNSRDVSAEATGQLNTIFMNWLGVPQLSVQASSTANESVMDIEIVLVLDVSGSMVDDGSTRLADLKRAANDFVRIVLANDPLPGRVSIGLVPFNGQVNLGDYLRSRFNVYDTAGVPTDVTGSRCVDLPREAYESLTLSRTRPIPATAWADSFTRSRNLVDSNGNIRDAFDDPAGSRPEAGNRWCPAIAANTVLLPTRNQTILTNRINGLVGEGATSINAGMRWGLTLLDPASRDIFTSGPPGTVQGRPFAFAEDKKMKVIVVLTDGAHWPEERMNDGYRTGPSPVYLAGDGRYSRHDRDFRDELPRGRPDGRDDENGRPEGYPFWVPHLAQWHWRAWNGTTPGSIPSECRDEDNDDSCNRVRGSVSQQNWTQVWTSLRVSWVAWQLYARAECASAGSAAQVCRNDTYSRQMAVFRSLTETERMDEQLASLCAMAFEQKIVLYGIAFQAPALGRAAIRDCVTNEGQYSDGNFFEINSGAQLTTDFATIAAQINALKLTR